MPTPNVTNARHSRRKPPVPAVPAAASSAGPEDFSGSATQSTRRDWLDPERKRLMIAEAAYYLAEKRGFAPGGDVQDWLEAEARTEARLRG